MWRHDAPNPNGSYGAWVWMAGPSPALPAGPPGYPPATPATWGPATPSLHPGSYPDSFMAHSAYPGVLCAL
jgi:hypothetical protein